MRSRVCRVTVLLLGVVVAVLATSPAARAQVTYLDARWTGPYVLKETSGAASACGMTWSGGGDTAGRFYHSCADRIQIRTAAGKLSASLNPGEIAGRRDVAPSPDGMFIYYTVGERKDQLTATDVAAGTGTVHRYKKVLNATTGKYAWKKDVNATTGKPWSVGPFSFWGSAPWSGRYLSVDGAGNLYVSTNAFVNVFDTTGKLLIDYTGQRTAAGALLSTTTIGGYDDPDGAGPMRGFDAIMGISVNAAGTRLYLVDEHHYVLARYDKGVDGVWRYARSVGIYSVASADCLDDRFSAPYDVGLDGAGNAYVADTTCGRIRRYSGELTTPETIYQVSQCNLCFKPHGIVVNAQGDFIFPWTGQRFNTGA